MVKKNFLAIFLLSIAVTGLAQNSVNSEMYQKKIDSFKIELAKATVDSNKVKIYCQIAYNFYWLVKYDSSAYYSNIGIRLARKCKFSSGEKLILEDIIFYNNRIGNYNKALEVALELIRISEETKDTIYLCRTYLQIGSIYSDQNNYKRALEYHIKSLIFSRVVYPESALSVNYENIGNCYMDLGILDSSLKYFQKGYEVAMIEKKPYDLFLSLINLGEINLKFGNYNIALPYLRKACSVLKEEDDYGLFSELYIDIAKNFIAIKQNDSAIFFARKAYYLSKSTALPKSIMNSSKLLEDLYFGKKMIDSAYKFQTEMIIAKDSLFSEEKIRQIEIISIDEIKRQNEIEEQKIIQHEERARNLRLGFIAIFIPTLGAFVYVLSRKKKKSTRVVTLLGVASLLMLFEFISLLIHPVIEKITHHDALFMYLILLVIASILVPLHHKLESFVKRKLQ